MMDDYQKMRSLNFCLDAVELVYSRFLHSKSVHECLKFRVRIFSFVFMNLYVYIYELVHDFIREFVCELRMYTEFVIFGRT